MILRSVELENFGRFKGKTVEFRRGMNLVIGPNEAGKSTLAEVVPAVLFGTDRLEKYRPWGRNSCSAALFFEGHGHTIQIRRNLITDEVELVERDDLYHPRSQFAGKAPLKGRSASCREYRGLLESLLGVGDDKLFRATYFFGHHPQEWTGDDLAQKLRVLVSGSAESDYADILDNLLEEHFRLTRSNPWGRDKQHDREYEQLCQQLEASDEKDQVPAFVELDSSDDLKQQIDKLTAEIEHDQGEYRKGQDYIDRLRSNLTDSTRGFTAEVVDSPVAAPPPEPDDASFAERLKAAGLPPNPSADLPEILSEAAAIRQELATLQQPIATLNSKEQRLPKVPWAFLAALVALCAVAAGVAWWRQLYFSQVLGVASLCTLVALSWGGWRHVSRSKALNACRRERSRLEQKKHAAQQRQSLLSERCEALGLPSSAIDLVRLQKLVTVHRELLDHFWAAQQDGGTAAPTVAETPPRVEESRRPAEATEDDGAQQAELNELSERMVEFEQRLTRKRKALQELEAQLAGSGAEAAVPGTGSNATLVIRKVEIEKRIAVLRKAISLLAEAVDEFGRSHLVHLNDEASKILGQITGGRYPEIKLDENMTPSIRVDGKRWVSAEHLSRGTVDAVYLALRIALAKVRDDGRCLPSMLDDPFVHLDQKRLAKTLNLVDLASADGQLILFSHNLDLGKRAARERWHVIPLDGDSEDTHSEQGDEHAGQLHLL